MTGSGVACTTLLAVLAAPWPAAPARLLAQEAPPRPKAEARAPVEPQTRIEAQVVGPNDPNLQFDISPRGAHFGTVLAKGSRVVVAIDGVEGPRFDDILPIAAGAQNSRISFSPDGSRYAYVGRQGQELVVIVDGKETLRVPVGITQILGPQGHPGPHFTPNGKHVFWVLHTQKSTMAGEMYYQFYFDGVAGPRSNDVPMVFFSPSGDRYAYLVTNPVNREQQALFVDGKPAGYPPAGFVVQAGMGSEFRFTGDGAHLFVKSSVPRMPATQLFVDGRPFLRAAGATLYAAPMGNAFATVVSQGDPGGPAYQFIDFAGRKVPGSEGSMIDSVRWSADGRHWAARVTTAARSMFVIADGKKGLEYQNVGEIAFTAAGTVVYHAMNNNKHFLIVGAEESDGYQSIYGVSPISSNAQQPFLIAGNQVGFMALAPQGGFDRLAVVGGKALARRNAADLTLSPDGSRFAFAFDGGMNVDGTDVPNVGIIPFKPAPVNRQAMPPARFLFSPDSKHLVAFGRRAGADAPGIFVDGKFLAAGNGSPHTPTFTPDGRHLFWRDHLLNDPHWAVYLDGKPVALFDRSSASIYNYPGYWDMGPEGVLTVIGPTEEGMKRIRITPGSNSSIEALSGKEGRER
jgi:hypothetical protein